MKQSISAKLLVTALITGLCTVVPHYAAASDASPEIERPAAIEGLDPIVVPKPITRGRIIKKPVADVLGDTRKFAKATKVVVPFFTVQFNKKAGESASASVGGPLASGASTKVSVTAKLTGVEESTFQTVTDLAYQDLSGKLTSAGFEMVSPDELQKAKSYQKWDAKKFPKSGKKKSVHNATGTRYPGKLTYAGKWGTLMNDTQATVIQPSYVVDFVSFGKKADSGVKKASAKVELGPVVFAMGGLMGIVVKKCNKRGKCKGDMFNVSLGQPTYSSLPFGSLKNTTSKGLKAAQGALNILSSLNGTSKFKNSKMTLSASNDHYQTAALEALYEANTRLVNKLKAASK